MIIDNYKKLLKGLPKNLYIFTKVTVKDGKSSHTINADIPDSVMRNLLKHINSSNMEDVVFVCRSEKEWNFNKYPKDKQMNIIESDCNKKFTIFYQDPWPSSVPNFDSNKTIIRFGYDEGCKLDKMSNTWIDLQVFNRYTEGDDYYNDGKYDQENYYLLNESKITLIPNNTSII